MRTFIIFLAAAYAAQGQTSILKHSFENDTEGWIAMGANGSVKVGKEAKSGSGALQFSYSLDNKAISSLVFPAGVGKSYRHAPHSVLAKNRSRHADRCRAG